MRSFLRNSLTLSAAALAGTLTASAKRPNIIFILVDDLGKEWIEHLGADIQTPNIDRIAEQGIEFTQAYSMPQSTPSRVALLTGQYPYNNGWINHFDVPRWGHGMHFDTQMNPAYPKELQKSGYKTCAAGKWQLDDFRLEPDAMNEIGFDEYCMWTGGELGVGPSGSRYWNPYIHTVEGSRTYKGQFGPDVYSDYIVNFLTENRDEPMFVYYPMALTHTPFTSTPLEPNAKTPYERHAAMVRYTDFIIGKIFKCVEDLGIADDTYIFFTTDNGTSGGVVGQRDGVYIFGGKTQLSQNGINPPFFVCSPKVDKPFKTDAVIDFTDVYPTVLDLAGVKRIDKRVTGISFANILRGKRKSGKREIALSMGGQNGMFDENDRAANIVSFRERAIIGEKYKIYLTQQRTIERIYDIKGDMYEQNNLVGNPEVEAEVEKVFRKYIDALPAVDNNPKYTQIDSPYAIDTETHNKRVTKSKGSYNYYRGLATKADYDEFRAKTSRK